MRARDYTLGAVVWARKIPVERVRCASWAVRRVVWSRSPVHTRSPRPGHQRSPWLAACADLRHHSL